MKLKSIAIKNHSIVSAPILKLAGALNFYSGSGACDQDSVSSEGVGVGGLVHYKFPNLESCELKISKFWGLRATILGL